MAGGTKAYAAVVLIRLMYSGMHVMSKVALDEGMNPLVFVFYRHTTAALALIPVAFILERRKAKPVTLKIAGKMFVHALYGVTACGDLFNLGLNYASATSSSALYNVQPVVTFILAVILGMESMKLRKFHGNLKAAGILFCIVGVTMLAFYEGPMFKSFNHHHLFQHGGSSSPGADAHSKTQWVFGIFLMTLSNVLAGLWTVLQGPLIEDTSKLMNTTLQISCASVQAFVVAVAAERDFSKWKLGWNVSLAAIIYSGVIVTALSYYMQMWTIAKRGPVFLAMSMPLTLIFTIIISSFVLGDAVSLGSIFAGILLIGGLYNVLWGKSIEEQDDMNKISAGKPGVELQDKEAQAPDDAAAKTDITAEIVMDTWLIMDTPTVWRNDATVRSSPIPHEDLSGDVSYFLVEDQAKVLSGSQLSSAPIPMQQVQLTPEVLGARIMREAAFPHPDPSARVASFILSISALPLPRALPPPHPAPICPALLQYLPAPPPPPDLLRPVPLRPAPLRALPPHRPVLICPAPLRALPPHRPVLICPAPLRSLPAPPRSAPPRPAPPRPAPPRPAPSSSAAPPRPAPISSSAPARPDLLRPPCVVGSSPETVGPCHPWRPAERSTFSRLPVASPRPRISSPSGGSTRAPSPVRSPTSRPLAPPAPSPSSKAAVAAAAPTDADSRVDSDDSSSTTSSKPSVASTATATTPADVNVTAAEDAGNLERFLTSTTPSVPAQYLPKIQSERSQFG